MTLPPEAPPRCAFCGGTKEHPRLVEAPPPNPYIGDWHGWPSPCTAPFHYTDDPQQP